MPTPCTLPLDSPAATLALAGGKGANLSQLIRAGFPTPGGFIITTAAYNAYVAANGLAAFIGQALTGLAAEDPAALEAASAAIRARFALGVLPADLATELRDVYLAQPISRMAVAVRSSATAEDLPDLSFAGQQDTFLNVVGPEAVLRAVVDCWSSLWTARAIGYRMRNGIGHDGIALAVVVQTMVDAEAAGVLFTANPLSGQRTESVIDATLGLGEALVSGQVEPDHYVVDDLARRIVAKRLGEKQQHAAVQALSDAAILELAALGKRVEQHFGAPQDIEWTWADGRLALVQARPITSLYPLPAGCDPAGELRVFASFGAFQGVMEPFTPLGQNMLAAVVAQVGSYLGYDYTWADVPALRAAGERLYVDLTPLLRNRIGRRVIRAALSQVEPGVGAAVTQILDDPRLAITEARPSPRLIRLMLPLAAPLGARLAATLLWPDHNRRVAQQGIEKAIVAFQERAEAATTLHQRLALVGEAVALLRRFMFVFLLPRVIAGLGSLNQLYRLADPLPAGRSMALEITRGLPHNVTTEMDLALWDAAQQIRADAEAAAALGDTASAALVAAYRRGQLPRVAQDVAAAFLARYGMRGPGEIDLGRPRWREDPAPIMDALRSYLQITDAALAPDAVFARGAAAAEQALERLVAALRQQPGGRRQAARARWAARRMRALAGLRETPKFTIIRMLGGIRAALLDSGAALAAAGRVAQAEDIFFLTIAELARLADGDGALDARGLVAERRARDEREKHRRQIPRLFLSNGQAFYEGAASGERDGWVLRGSPVSPGVVEGRVRVVRDPRGAQLAPGEILVCPGTDPSWTPLFLAAGGLVMEVGGMMTHGSVVAREYGIPAVVGVMEATLRLQTGQRIRVDGTRGEIALLEAEIAAGG